MGCSAQRPAVWQRERHLTDALEGLALLVRAITASAGVTLANVERRAASASAGLRGSGPDQRWRGAPAEVVVEVYPAGVHLNV
jgi:hypothetical protein